MKHYELICIATQANVPWLWKGLPGIGKTSIIEALAKKLGLPSQIVIGSISEPSDIGGFPVPTDDGNMVNRVPLQWAAMLQNKDGILVFDELPHSPPAIQAALLRVIFESKVGDMDLGPGVRRGAIGNPVEVAGGWNLNPALANRFCHIDWNNYGYPDYWYEGMMPGWDNIELPIPELPKDWELRKPHYRSLVGAFVGKIRTPLLLVLPESEDAKSGPWPSPRTWEMASTLMAASESFDNQKPLNDLQIDFLRGCVGEGAAGEFIGYLQAANLPDPEYLLKNPNTFPKIESGKEHMIYAILSNLMACLQNADLADKQKNARWTQAWFVIEEACKYGPDVAFGAFVQPMLRLRPSPRAKAPKVVSDRLIKYGQEVDILPGGPSESNTSGDD
jgi:MoxR-like ATPase